MTTPRHFLLDRLAIAGPALLLSGAVGAVVGLITGLTCGVFFVVYGALFGAIWGVPTGFCVGVLASAIGGRRVWRISGTLGEVLGAALMVAGLGQRSLAHNLADTGCFGLFIVGIAGIGGFVAGAFADTQLSRTACGTGLFSRLAMSSTRPTSES